MEQLNILIVIPGENNFKRQSFEKKMASKVLPASVMLNESMDEISDSKVRSTFVSCTECAGILKRQRKKKKKNSDCLNLKKTQESY